MSGATAGAIERVPGPGVWPLAVRAGQYLFLSGQVARDPVTGLLVGGYDDLPARGRWPRSGSLLVDGQEERTAAQIWWIYNQIGRELERLGSSRDDVLLLTGWLDDFRQWPVMNRLRQRTFGEGKYPPCTTFQAPVLGVDGAVALFETFALASGPLRKEPLGSARQVGHYFPGARVGPLLFLAGEVPADPERALVVRGYADLDAAGRALATGQIGADGWEGRIRAQAWYVYQRIAALLAANGSSLQRIAKQAVYLRDPRDYPAFEGISRLVLGERLPATTVVGVDEYGHRDFTIEIEVTALADDAPAPQRVESGPVPSLGPGFPLAVVAEPFVFPSLLLPLDESGRVLGEVPHGGGVTELAARQTAQIYTNLTAILAERGLGLESLVRQVIYVADPALVPAVQAAALAATRGAPPATTIVPVRALWPRPALVQVDCTAFAPA